MAQQQTPTIISKVLMPNEEARWIKLQKIVYKDQAGKERIWESAERTTRQRDCDAVAILPIMVRSSDPSSEPQTLIITQYRPPAGRTVVELPAGLIDANETAEDAAHRELREETGYVGKVLRTSSLMLNDPGLTNANMKLVTIEVDLDDPRNHGSIPEPDDGEFIEKHMVPLRTFIDVLGGKIETEVRRCEQQAAEHEGVCGNSGFRVALHD
ncbi:hypothetical protein HK102_006796 [Quaeritorhiza haematococci]|nr:hypothetical protein HK102_006796 [Quaeritorhiza haematococci]